MALSAQRSQRGVGHGFAFETKVNIEDIFPGFAGNRTRLNLGEVGSGGSELLERGNQGSRAMFDDKRGAELIRRANVKGMIVAAQQMEASKVFRVVFNALDQNFPAILLRSQRRSNRSNVAQTVLHDVLHAARGVIERRGA